jgi:hypothetical protein
VVCVLLAEGGIVEGTEEDGFARLFGSISRVSLDLKRCRLTAYAMRSPLGSVESWVGLPRSVLGDAARILSILRDMVGKALGYPELGEESWTEGVCF